MYLKVQNDPGMTNTQNAYVNFDFVTVNGYSCLQSAWNGKYLTLTLFNHRKHQFKVGLTDTCDEYSEVTYTLADG